MKRSRKTTRKPDALKLYKEALEQQAATAEILRVISNSPASVQPVFNAILERSLKLCDAHLGILNLYESGKVRTVTQRGARPGYAKWLVERGAFKPTGRLARVYQTKRALQTVDLKDTPLYRCGDPFTVKLVKLSGARTFLMVPLLKRGAAIGNIGIYRSEVRPFTENQIDLVSVFADQAVIAIENVRLFNETKEALERQTATAEILKVMAGSPSDVQPVFDTISRNALRLCGSLYAIVHRFDGELIHYASSHHVSPEQVEIMARGYPRPPDHTRAGGRAILSKSVVCIEDTLADPDYDSPATVSGGWRRILAVPMLRDGDPVGDIVVGWAEPGPIPKVQEELLKTFADQAVIAIENVRLFNETKESLEQQTAISEVLRVISGSPTDVKPVLDAVAVRAAKICEASDARIWLVEADCVRHVAGFGDVPMPVPLGDSVPLDRSTVSGRAIVEHAPVHVEDMAKLSRDDYPISREMQERSGFRTILAVPLMREQSALGAIMVRRMEVRRFTDKQIALLKTFADQAAIAIENVRLFNETKEALERQTATAAVLKVISDSPTDVQPVFDTIAERAATLCGARFCTLSTFDGELIHMAAIHGTSPQAASAVRAAYPMKPGSATLAARVIQNRGPLHIADVLADPEYAQKEAATKAGFRSVLGVPMMREGQLAGVIIIGREEVGHFPDKEVDLLKTFADQAAIAIQNVRLFNEIREKSALLEVANKHKSEFLANMSHELRTPLNAVIGFSEVLSDRMFGEINEKQADYLKDIHESGKHLLSLINDILDLSKIEAGRMELDLATFHLPSAISNAMTLIRERAQRHGIQLGAAIDPRLGEFQADERKLKQILLNLLSNAVKFTPDGGRVDVDARLDSDRISISVRDTGVGISPEDQAALFEEFKQVGKDAGRRAEGTGLGLALARRFVELHGGEIGLESAPGQGSTFTFTLPVRA